jgi:hypothetical protein
MRAISTLFAKYSMAVSGSSCRKRHAAGCGHPTAVVAQTPVIEWVRWLDALAEFIKRCDKH